MVTRSPSRPLPSLSGKENANFSTNIFGGCESTSTVDCDVRLPPAALSAAASSADLIKGNNRDLTATMSYKIC